MPCRFLYIYSKIRTLLPTGISFPKYYENHEKNKEKNRESWRRYKERHAEEIRKKDRERYAIRKEKMLKND